MSSMKLVNIDFRASFTRNYPLKHQSHEYCYIENKGTIEEGDLILCKSLDPTFVESPEGSLSRVYPNSTVLSVWAKRESTGYNVGCAPKTKLPTHKKYQLLTESGVTGMCTSYRNDSKKPTDVNILGKVVDEKGQKITMESLAVITPSDKIYSEVPSIFIVGSSTDSGKTMIGSYLVNYFNRMRKKIGCIKATGTMSVRENNEYFDAGASFVIDAADAGFATTYTEQSSKIVRVFKGLINEAESRNPDIIFVELGGDIIGANSESILMDDEIRKNIECLLLAAKDSFAALGVVTYLEKKLNLKPMVISGLVAVNELCCRRCTEITGIQTVDISKQYKEIGDKIIIELFS